MVRCRSAKSTTLVRIQYGSHLYIRKLHTRTNNDIEVH
nr:MAG TPA: hypothetical protein [Ackermannviridae sp.]